MGNRLEGPVRQWRGFDPWWPGACPSYTLLLVRAPCDAVVSALQSQRDAVLGDRMPGRMIDLLASCDIAIGCLREEPAFVYQLEGHDWTQVEYRPKPWLLDGLIGDLSLRLKSLAFLIQFCAIGGGQHYELYDEGERVEAYGPLEPAVYQGDEGEAELRRMLLEGWLISSKREFGLLTRRGTELDIESPEECYHLTERVVMGLGMFIAWPPWWFQEESGRIECMRGWGREDFSAAKALYRDELDRVPPTEKYDTKLIIRESSPEWRNLQKEPKRRG